MTSIHGRWFETEHAISLSGGSMEVRTNDPDVEKIYPVERWIENTKRHGRKVYRRVIIVVDDWKEV